MRQPFWNKENLNELVQKYKSSTHYGLRIAWENRYNQPSHGNPLFEDVPVATHVLHFLALDDDGEADHTPDDSFQNMIRSIENGDDPFADFRSKLEAFDDKANLVHDDEDFDDIDF